MLTAPKIREHSTAEEFDLSRTNNNERKKTKIKTNPRKIKFLLCSFMLISFVMGLALMFLAADVNAKGHELNSIKRELNSWQISNERLQLEKARLLAPGNIEGIAINQLGMERPQFGNLKMITTEEIAIAETLLSLHNPSTNRELYVADNDSSVSLMAAIANIFSGWAVIGKH